MGRDVVFVSTPGHSADLMAEQRSSDARRSSKLKLEVFAERKLLRDKMIGESEDNIQALLGLGGNGGDGSRFRPSSGSSFNYFSRRLQAPQELEISISWNPV
jgi:hypothetical protein